GGTSCEFSGRGPGRLISPLLSTGSAPCPPEPVPGPGAADDRRATNQFPHDGLARRVLRVTAHITIVARPPASHLSAGSSAGRAAYRTVRARQLSIGPVQIGGSAIRGRQDWRTMTPQKHPPDPGQFVESTTKRLLSRFDRL